jgi:hypothetical protein
MLNVFRSLFCCFVASLYLFSSYYLPLVAFFFLYCGAAAVLLEAKYTPVIDIVVVAHSNLGPRVARSVTV